MFGAFASQLLVYLLAAVAFGALVIVHELGHYAVARLCGMRVERFSVGFGPVILRRSVGETEWAVSALPLGGYVKIAGMAPGDDIQDDDPGAYANKPAWRRFLVIVAGPAMNYVFAVVLAVAMLSGHMFREADPRAVVGEVIAGSAAKEAGLQTGDQILAVDGHQVADWQALVQEIQSRPGVRADLTLERGGAQLHLAATPKADGKIGRLGIAPTTRPVEGGPGEAIARTNARAAEILTGLGQMITGRQKGELHGPLGIATAMAHSAQSGAADFLGLVWYISIALAMFNLLPVPALDGGRLVFLVYEIVTRRRVNQRVEQMVHLAGMVALLGLLVAVTLFGDLPSLFRR
jgi:regulator of sigma E protease